MDNWMIHKLMLENQILRDTIKILRRGEDFEFDVALAAIGMGGTPKLENEYEDALPFPENEL